MWIDQVMVSCEASLYCHVAALDTLAVYGNAKKGPSLCAGHVPVLGVWAHRARPSLYSLSELPFSLSPSPPSLLSYRAFQSSALMPLEGQVVSHTSSASETLPRTPTQISARPFHHRVWSSLSGKERQWIGWRRSACAIVFSSC